MADYTLKLGGKLYNFDGRAVEAARKASRVAVRGATINGKYVPPGRAQVLDASTGKVLMTCHPSDISVKSIMRHNGKKKIRPFAKCTIKPGFKSAIAPRKRRRR